MTQKEKTKYRGTKKWKDMRLRLIDEADGKCAICGKEYRGKQKKKLCIHHINESAYGEETDEDTEVLCQKCHRYFHSIAQIVYGKTSKPNKWYPWFKKILDEYFPEGMFD
jgi:5-methylcytosine-specific restriction endonuclease McrA